MRKGVYTVILQNEELSYKSAIETLKCVEI